MKTNPSKLLVTKIENEVLKLNPIKRIAFLILIYWWKYSAQFTLNRVLYTGLVIIPAATISLAQKEHPLTLYLQVAWGLLLIIGLAALLKHRPAKKYHYIHERRKHPR